MLRIHWQTMETDSWLLPENLISVTWSDDLFGNTKEFIPCEKMSCMTIHFSLNLLLNALRSLTSIRNDWNSINCGGRGRRSFCPNREEFYKYIRLVFFKIFLHQLITKCNNGEFCPALQYLVLWILFSQVCFSVMHYCMSFIIFRDVISRGGKTTSLTGKLRRQEGLLLSRQTAWWRKPHRIKDDCTL